MAKFLEAKRVMESPLARLEKKTLVWLAGRLPQWVNSDHLTAVGFAAMLGAGVCFWLGRWSRGWLIGVVVMLAVNWFGDSLDGTLARVRNRQRPRYGFYVDHIIDAFGMLFLMAGMALSGFMSWQIAMGIVVAYFLISIEVYLATYTLRRFQITFAGFGPTELRIVLAIGALALWNRPMVSVASVSYQLFDVGGAIATAGMLAVATVSAIKNARILYLQERLL
ncbi:MAG TPA: CDP-alcohol phosphatidyltransferase family protein [Terriglobales bacterium]|nr:CDP-alcohol phosphatidyltransferase family protein [Terriglobales bacterium]